VGKVLQKVAFEIIRRHFEDPLEISKQHLPYGFAFQSVL
jgi:hypothetical protein